MAPAITTLNRNIEESSDSGIHFARECFKQQLCLQLLQHVEMFQQNIYICISDETKTKMFVSFERIRPTLHMCRPAHVTRVSSEQC